MSGSEWRGSSGRLGRSPDPRPGLSCGQRRGVTLHVWLGLSPIPEQTRFGLIIFGFEDFFLNISRDHRYVAGGEPMPPAALHYNFFPEKNFLQLATIILFIILFLLLMRFVSFYIVLSLYLVRTFLVSFYGSRHMSCCLIEARLQATQLKSRPVPARRRGSRPYWAPP